MYFSERISMNMEINNLIFSKELNYFGCRVQGASHIREGKQCQDFFEIYSESTADDKIIIIAVADGHGNKKYDLSRYGAEFAVKAAIEELKLIYHFSRGSKGQILKTLRSDFQTSILKRWREAIVSDIKIREEEFYKTNLNNLEQVYKRYGTTLMAVLIAPEGIFMAQLGDGDILLVEANGKTEFPIPRAEELIANETYSMTSRDSTRLWKFQMYSTAEPVLIMLSTDGLSNSFEDDSSFARFGVSLLHNINKFGIEKVAKEVPNFLNRASKNGSGDDITLAFAVVDICRDNVCK
jgi:serine/threonine protein phosphatase PrpC